MTAPVKGDTRGRGRLSYTSDMESVGRILARLAEADPLPQTRKRRPTIEAGRVAFALVCGLLIALGAFEVSRLIGELPKGGQDYRLYMTAAQEWLASGQFYAPYQLAGPYPVVKSEVLYPPPALLLFVPFSFLPPVLWWIVPLGIIAGVVISHRPSRWRWAGILALLVLPITGAWSWTMDVVYNGNPAMWAAAFVALATRLPFFGPFALVKFTLAPFALIGIRSRSWWAGLAVVALASLAFLPMWPDYLTVLRNAVTPGNPLLYAISSTAIALIPLVAQQRSQDPRLRLHRRYRLSEGR